MADLTGGVRRAAGQGAHLIGDHGKTPAMLAGPGGFNGGVQGEQVGLFSNLGNHADHLLYLAGGRRQDLDCLRHFTNHPDGMVSRLFRAPQALLDAMVALHCRGNGGP